MQKFKPLLLELIWVFVILNITVLLAIFVFGWKSFTRTFDIHLHDTYFTVSSKKILFPLFIFFTCFVFLIKEIKHQYNRKIPDALILVSGLILIVLIATGNKQIVLSGAIFYGGSSAYPSLSAISSSYVEATISPAIHIISNTLTVIQFFTTVCLLYVAFRMGGQRGVPVTPAQPVLPVKPKQPVAQVKQKEDGKGKA